MSHHLTGRRGPETNRWLGDKVGNKGIHAWLRREFGEPRKCEHCGSTKKKWYDWACKDHKYHRVRKDYMRLCRPCHRKYDYKFNGQSVSKETRAKMSRSQKERRRKEKATLRNYYHDPTNHQV